jgi:hypothetical protein
MPLRRDIAGADMAAHWHACQAQCEVWRQRRKGGVRTGAASERIRHDADLMATRRLSQRQVNHVTE